MNYNQEIKQVMNQILAEARVIEAKIECYENLLDLTKILEVMTGIYEQITSFSYQLSPLPSKLRQIDIDDAYIQTFHRTGTE